MEGQHRLHDLEEGVADWAKNAFAGGTAGLIVHTVVSPLERVKQLLQVSGLGLSNDTIEMFFLVRG